MFHNYAPKDTSTKTSFQTVDSKSEKISEYPVKYKYPRSASYVDLVRKKNEFYLPIDGCRQGKYRKFQDDSFLQDAKYVRRLKLAKIDEIIEIFVPTMRETRIRRDFALKMVNL